MTLRGVVGSVIVAVGGMFLFIALYLVLWTALYRYYDPTSGMIGAMFFGFVGSWLVAYGFSLMTKSAVSS